MTMNDLSPNAFLIFMVSVVCVSLLEILAIHRGLDGTALSAAIGVIGLVIGYVGRYLMGRRKS
jgi:hypothetical protein